MDEMKELDEMGEEVILAEFNEIELYKMIETYKVNNNIDEIDEIDEIIKDNRKIGLWGSRGILVIVAILYGTNFACVKLLQQTVPVSLAFALRILISAFPLLPFLFKLNFEIFKAGVWIGIFLAIGYWVQAISLISITASKSVFMNSLAVIVIPFVDKIYNKITGKNSDSGLFFYGPWFKAFLAVSGVACIELWGQESILNKGDIWAIFQPISFGISYWLTEYYYKKYPNDSICMVSINIVTIAVFSIVWCIIDGQPSSLEILRDAVFPSSGSLVVILTLLWTGLVTTLLTIYLETIAMGYVSAAEMTLIMSTEPIWGTIFAFILLGETVGWVSGIGAILIILACCWGSIGPFIYKKIYTETEEFINLQGGEFV